MSIFTPAKTNVKAPEVSSLCYHCGGEVLQAIEFDDKTFCCEGCQTVYELLQTNQLGTYYRLSEGSGPGLRRGPIQDYAYLDNPEVAEGLYDFVEGNLARIALFLPTIHCSSCIWLLEHLHRLSPGVHQVLVNFGKKQADITFDRSVLPLSALAALLQDIGYAPNFSLARRREDRSPEAQKAAAKRSLSYKIAVSGFVFGNSMLFSFPDYLALDPELLVDYQPFFNVLNFLFAIPIITYAASDYFRAAWGNLKHGSLGIDVPLAVGMLALFGWSSYEIFSGIGTGYFDSLSGLLFFLLVGRWYQQRSYETLSFERDYRAYFPLATTLVKSDGSSEYVPLSALKTGDRLRIRNQELIPADAFLLSEQASLDYSFVTGEAKPAPKVKGDKLYAGGRQVGESIEIEVRRPVDQSYLTQLWNAQGKEKESHRLSEMLHQAGTFFTLLTLVAALGALAFWSWADSSKALLTFVSILIVACPCALSLSMPYAFGNVLRLFGRRGFYLKNVGVVERLGQIDTLVFDKTGTLTEGSRDSVRFIGQDLETSQASALRSLARQSTHPLSRSVERYLEDFPPFGRVQDFEEIPGKGLSAYIEGKHYRLGSASWLGLNVQNTTSQEAASRVYADCEGEYLGYFELQKQYREGLDNLFEQLRAKYKIHLLSGDSDAEKPLLQAWFKDEELHFRQSPQDKKAFVEALQAQGHKVMMLGDGLNDAGALQTACVGLAIAEDVHSFTPASAAILAGQQLKYLAYFLTFAGKARGLLRASFALSLAYNLVGLSVAIQGLLTPLVAAILMPLSSVSVVVFVVLGGSWLAWRNLPLVSPESDLGHLKH